MNGEINIKPAIICFFESNIYQMFELCNAQSFFIFYILEVKFKAHLQTLSTHSKGDYCENDLLAVWILVAGDQIYANLLVLCAN